MPGSAGSSWQLLQGTYTGSTDGPIDFMFGYVGTVGPGFLIRPCSLGTKLMLLSLVRLKVSAVYMNDDCFFVRVGTN